MAGGIDLVRRNQFGPVLGTYVRVGSLQTRVCIFVVFSDGAKNLNTSTDQRDRARLKIR